MLYSSYHILYSKQMFAVRILANMFNIFNGNISLGNPDLIP